jgi:DNA-binding beta-propeller fold protein YncE
MIKHLFLTVIIMIIVSCSHEPAVSTVAFTLSEKDLIPEGIAYDPVTRQVFVSSIGKEKILAVSEEGKENDFALPGQDSLMQTLGMKVDAKRRRLWVVSNKTVDKITASAVHVYDIDSKLLLKRIIVKDTVSQLFNDLALNSRGDAYITDSYKSKVYHLGFDSGSLELFAGPDSLLRFVNGIAVSADDKLIYAAAGAYITIIDADNKSLNPIIDQSNTGTGGIDGIVLYDGSLIGVTNSKNTENEMFVAKYELSSDLREIKKVIILDKGNPLFNLPTTCTVAGDELLYLGHTSLRLYFQDKSDSKGLFMNPLILKYSLSGE